MTKTDWLFIVLASIFLWVAIVAAATWGWPS